jgi:phosphomannomutase
MSGKGTYLDPTILREYDIRGIAGENLNSESATAIGRALGTMVAADGGRTAALGFDGRLTSPELEKAMANGLAAAGLKVFRIGMGPTPMLYYAAHVLDTDLGVMITGSHNPPEYNGIKMVRRGKAVYGQAIQELGRIAAAGDFIEAEGEMQARPIIDEYVARLVEDFHAGEKDLAVAWDAGNGSAGEALEKLTAHLPGRHVLLNEKIDGTFPAHHPDPTVEKNLEQLKQKVKAEKCDLGIAFDGDGDRIGVVDGKGRVLWGDQILVILAAEILERKPGSIIIADVKASQVFFDEINRLGGKALMWKTGHSLIKAKMRQTGAPLAGEMSAHIFFADGYFGYDDALYCAVRLLTIIGRSGKSLAEIRDAMPKMVNTPELRFDCREEIKFRVIDEVAARVAAMDDVEVTDIDGVRVLNKDGWWLLRASNTQAVLVARCESESEEGLGRLKETLSAQLKQSGIAAPDFD